MSSSEQVTSQPINDLASRTYTFALAHMLHLSARSARTLLNIFPTVKSWHSTDEETRRYVERILRDKTNEVMTLNWDKVLEAAFNHIETHTRAGIKSIPIQDTRYPQLLRLIDDPPLILFVKGSLRACSELPGVAVIGTKNTTSLGEKVASKIASSFAGKGIQHY